MRPDGKQNAERPQREQQVFQQHKQGQQCFQQGQQQDQFFPGLQRQEQQRKESPLEKPAMPETTTKPRVFGTF